MAISKQPNGKYQARLRGRDGRVISKVFDRLRDAQNFESETRHDVKSGTAATLTEWSLTLDQNFDRWFETVQSRASKGWRDQQRHLFQKFVKPTMGHLRMEAIFPHHVAQVLNEMVRQKKAEQTQLHVFTLMRMLFGDAIELFRLLTFNPAQKTLKPKVPIKETAHLNMEAAKKLLAHVVDRPYGVAIWLQLYLGLRMGEVQALVWENVDLTDGIVSIRRTYVRKEQVTRDYPKGRRHHSHKMPSELLGYLRKRREAATDVFVATSPEGGMLSYEWYSRTLTRYCKELAIPLIGTHGLRHSTSALYLSNGATHDDIRQLFAHSASSVTERYIHQRGSNLEKVAQVIRLFP